jgi:transglutaminase/protease-like cytokinesis protein 3
LENFEVAELDITVPHGVEMIAEVDIRNLKDDAPTSSFEEYKFPGLAQPFWKDNKRYYRVKAVVPESYSQGTLNIYIGDRQQQTVNNINNVSLAYSIGITHSGQNAPFEFVTRHCTPHCKRQDIYVIQPQCKKLVGGNNYTFSINQHPSTGLTSGSGFSRTKLAIQSPSGKITKLSKKKNASDNQAGLVCGTWESSVKCLEVGTWRGLVLADNGNAWSVFAEWYCV